VGVIAHLDQIQPLRRRRDAGAPAVASFQHLGKPVDGALATTDREQRADDVAHHVQQEGIGHDVDREQIAVALDRDAVDAAHRRA